MSPRPALVKARGVTVRSDVGSYCTTGRPRHGAQSGICADSSYPKPSQSLPVSGGDRLYLRFPRNPQIFDGVRSVFVQAVRLEHHRVSAIGGAPRAQRVKGHPRRWHAELPEALGKANALDISVSYPDGDADFVTGLRSP
jgi:hypothetical protein